MFNIDHPHPLTIRETAQVLGVSRSTVYRLIEVGELDRIYIRKAPRILPEEIERFIRRMEKRQRHDEVA